MNTRLTALLRGAALILAPSLLVVGGLYHPWIGSPSDSGFLSRLAAAVADDSTRWAVAHLLVAAGSAFMMLAFLAFYGYLREHSSERWSATGLPFIVVGSTLYALLPAMEFAPLAAVSIGADAAAAQEAILPWFFPILLTGALTFAVGAICFAVGLVRSGVLGAASTGVVVAALLVMAVARFAPVGAAQLYVGPLAGVVALWPLAFRILGTSKTATSGKSRLAGNANA